MLLYAKRMFESIIEHMFIKCNRYILGNVVKAATRKEFYVSVHKNVLDLWIIGFRSQADAWAGWSKSRIKQKGVQIMHVQDKRAVETMCRCGINLEGILKMFPMFQPEEVEGIFWDVLGEKIVDVAKKEVNL